MSVPLVVIEVDAHEAPRSLANALAEACSGSIPEGECRYDEPADRTPIAIATVKWDGAGERSVRIEVGTKRRGEPEWLSKTLQFRSVDPRAERWRSVGLTIATLVRELSASAPPSATKSEADRGAAGSGTTSGLAATTGTASAPSQRQGDAARPEGAAPAPAAPPAPPPSSDGPASGAVPAGDSDAGGADRAGTAVRPDFRTPFWVDLGALSGPAFTAGDARIGAFAALGVHPDWSPVFGRFSLAHEVHPAGSDSLGARFTTITVGAGAAIRWRPARLALEPRVAFLLEHLGVSASDALGRSDDSSQWSAGALAGASLVWELSWIAPVIGLEGFWRGSPTDIIVENQHLATVPAVSWTFQGAVRLFL